MKRKVGINLKIILVIVLIVAIIIVGAKLILQKDVRFNECDPDDPGCVPEEEDTDTWVEDCSVVTPDKHCIKDAKGVYVWDPSLPGCGTCGLCGELETPNPYEGTAPDPSKPCEICNADGDVANAPEGSELDECSRCGFAGEVVAINEGQPVLECSICSGGKIVDAPDGNLPGDDDGISCRECLYGFGVDKDVDDSCNEQITVFGDPTLFAGSCKLFEEPDGQGGELYCECNVVECKVGEKKRAVPSLDPINDKIGYKSCNVIHSNDDGDATCSKWLPEPKGVTSCNTCSQEFDSVEGCKDLDKKGKKALADANTPCKYKSWFGLGKIKSGKCNKRGSCSRSKSFFVEISEVVSNAADYAGAQIRAVSEFKQQMEEEGCKVGPFNMKAILGDKVKILGSDGITPIGWGSEYKLQFSGQCEDD